MSRDYSLCMHCGEPEAHYVPPGGGMTGFFMCDPDDKPESSWGPGPNQRQFINPETGVIDAVQENL